jgi:hypothetical protein
VLLAYHYFPKKSSIIGGNKIKRDASLTRVPIKIRTANGRPYGADLMNNE